MEPGPTADLQNPLEAAVETEMGKVPQGGSARDLGPELLYSILGWRGIQAPSVIWTAGGSASNGSRQCASRVCPYQPEDSGRTGSHQV